MIPPSTTHAPELAPSLFIRSIAPVRGPGNTAETLIEARYASLVVANDRERCRMERIRKFLGRYGSTAVAIKGGACILDLYTGALPRHLSDIDLVIAHSDFHEVCTALAEAGYQPEPWNGPEDRFLQAQEGPGLRCLAPGKLPVDLQTRLPGVPAESPALDEALAAARPVEAVLRGSGLSDGPDGCHALDTSGCADRGLLILHPMHELLVAAAHLCVHLKPPLTLSPKWITDMLLMIHRNATGRHPRVGPPVEGATFEEKLAKITLEELIWPFAEPVRGEPEPAWVPVWSWNDFWQTAQRWGIVQQCHIVGATLNAYWNAGVPDVPPGQEPIPLKLLFETAPDHGVQSAAALPAAYAERISRMRALPDARSRMRYLLSLAFPSADSLRHRYGLADNASVIPYRFVHPVRTAWKLMRGIGAAIRIALRRRS